MARTPSPDSRPAVAAWLFACCALVFAMVVVGGITRLTHSGLSIVEWQPVMGAIPPLGDAQWQAEFDKYKLSPEYLQRNFDMTLAGFKGIFWWEYSHRLLGRIIGAAFLLPFLYFLARGQVRGGLAWRLAGIFVLGGLQGAVGWLMVASGLVDDPRVSSVRLAAHLGIAFLIYGALLWLALGLVTEPEPRVGRGLLRLSRAFAALVFVMVLSGALVAGIHAGLAYNTFPRMNGEWIPDEVMLIDPWWKNLVFNMATVQLDHRIIAMLVALGAIWSWSWARRSGAPRQRAWANALLIAAALQVCAGIATLLLRVPIPLAAIHQAGALAVFTCALGLAHALQGGPDYNGKGGAAGM
ncbi:MAG TPA: COX15/CtaA family protein [Usitatibacter sp.]|jgi:cytochrome c oxidase assembly protein subunit 15